MLSIRQYASGLFQIVLRYSVSRMYIVSTDVGRPRVQRHVLRVWYFGSLVILFEQLSLRNSRAHEENKTVLERVKIANAFIIKYKFLKNNQRLTVAQRILLNA
jgi:hypothetical protein